VDNDGIASYFTTKEVGTVDAKAGTLFGVNFHIYSMKEPDYIMTEMTT